MTLPNDLTRAAIMDRALELAFQALPIIIRVDNTAEELRLWGAYPTGAASDPARFERILWTDLPSMEKAERVLTEVFRKIELKVVPPEDRPENNQRAPRR